jgi:hypothetical protein
MTPEIASNGIILPILGNDNSCKQLDMKFDLSINIGVLSSVHYSTAMVSIDFLHADYVGIGFG